MTKLPLRLYHAFMNIIFHLSITWFYFLWWFSLWYPTINGSFFDIPDEPLCYVRQCSLFDNLILNSLYEMCLGVLHYISLYALSLQSTLAHLQVPFLCMLGGIRELALHDIINSNFYYFTTYNSNQNLFIIINILFTHAIDIHKLLLIWTLCWLTFYLCEAFHLQLWWVRVPSPQKKSIWILFITYIDN